MTNLTDQQQLAVLQAAMRGVGHEVHKLTELSPLPWTRSMISKFECTRTMSSSTSMEHMLLLKHRICRGLPQDYTESSGWRH